MRAQRVLCRLLASLVGLVIVMGIATPPLAWAGPVDWNEVAPTAEGRQWWDRGSLRLSRQGQLTVLSRFQPAAPEPTSAGSVGRAAPGQLYVMELDCGQELYRDISVNGLPRFRAEWQPVAGDDLSTRILQAACRAGADLLMASGGQEGVGG